MFNQLRISFIKSGICPLPFFNALKCIISKEAHNYSFNCARFSSSRTSLNLSGIYPPIATTFDDHGSISWDKLKDNIKKWESIPFRGYVVLGSTGEYVSLNEDEKIQLVKFVKENMSCTPDKLIIAGSGCESTGSTIELTNKMANVGAHAALVVSPFFYKGRMTEDTLYSHYMKVADSSEIPIILYSVPPNTSIDLSASLVTRLAEHPNIIGLKDSGGDITKIALIAHKTKQKNFQVLAGSAGFLYPALCIGCVGGVLALANSLGKPLCDLYQCAVDGRHKEAQDLQHRVIGPNLSVTRQFGIAGVKASMELLGYHGGPCRPPLKSLSHNELTQLKKEFESNGFV